jgi:hypothetical protein
VAVRQFHAWGVLEGLWPDKGIGLVRTPAITDSDIKAPLQPDQVQILLDGCVSSIE